MKKWLAKTDNMKIVGNYLLHILSIFLCNLCLQIEANSSSSSAAHEHEHRISVFSACSNSSQLPLPGKVNLPNCTVFSNKPFFKSECFRSGSSSNSNQIKIWTSKNATHTFVQCTSDKYMFVNILFNEGVPFTNLTESFVHVERFAKSTTATTGQNFNNATVAVVSYVIKLFPVKRAIIRYSISHVAPAPRAPIPIDASTNLVPDLHNSVTLMILNGGLNELTGPGTDAWWMSYFRNVSIFEATQKIVVIPCILQDKLKPSILTSVENVGGKEILVPLPVDNVTISYEPFSGFHFNTSAFQNYNKFLFRCSAGAASFWDFRITDLPELKVKPEMPKNGEPMRLFATKEQNDSPIRLECNFQSPIRLDGSLTTNVANDSSYMEKFYSVGRVRYLPISENIKVSDGTTYEVRKLNGKSRYVAKYYSVLSVFDELVISCTREADGAVLYSWVVTVHDAGPEPYTGPNYLKLIYDETTVVSSRWEDYEYQCISKVYDDTLLRTIRCSNKLQCSLLERCFNEEQECRSLINRGTPCPPGWLIPDKSCSQSKALIPGGLLQCTAGGHTFTQLHFTGFDGLIYHYNGKFLPGAIIRVEIPADDVLYTKVSYIFNCTVHQFISEGEIHFVFTSTSAELEISRRPEISNTNKSMATDLSPYSQSSDIKFGEPGTYDFKCSAPALFSPDRWYHSEVNKFEVQESVAPQILTELTDRDLDENIADQTIECRASGIPDPKIEWSKMGEDFPLEVVDGGNNTSILKFGNLNDAMVGVYTCRASNVAGNDSKEFVVSKKKDMTLQITILSIAGGILLMLIPFLIILRRYQNAKKPVAQFTKLEIHAFLHGTPAPPAQVVVEAQTEPNTTCSNKNHLPLPQQFIISKQNIDQEKQRTLLGVGEFGEVYLGYLVGIKKAVAFKIPKSDCPKAMVDDLLQELKVMAYMKPHPNVVLLIGGYLAELHEGVGPYIVTEYCEHGSLEKYLKKNRAHYNNCSDAGSAQLIEKIAKNEACSSSKSDYESKETSFCTGFGFKQLLRWSAEVACGMEFLSSQKIIHLDLAARNVLLSLELTAKISDFGLSRKLLYENVPNYVKRRDRDAKVPWRSLAIECLLESKFTTESDVWAYGVLLWEIFSLGLCPFYEVVFVSLVSFGHQLQNGLRNPKPEHATDEIYDLMTKCWDERPDQRSTFTKLFEFFVNLEKSGVKPHYLKAAAENET